MIADSPLIARGWIRRPEGVYSLPGIASRYTPEQALDALKYAELEKEKLREALIQKLKGVSDSPYFALIYSQIAGMIREAP